ncbi:MAG: DUF4258 domain-containing protein [Spirochaetaceae bacterium]|nr:MAG: DUF4258 domain-containing protein [Spirochaetaceae bacterium]
MKSVNTGDIEAIAERLAFQAQKESIRVTVHAHQEMVEEDILLDDVLCALRQAKIVENYPEHRRGPCCLIHGKNSTGRDLHVVCTTSLDVAIIITVYEPKPPKWKNPFTRGRT